MRSRTESTASSTFRYHLGPQLKHPKELLKKDQEVDAIVTNIDIHGQRLSLDERPDAECMGVVHRDPQAG